MKKNNFIIILFLNAAFVTSFLYSCKRCGVSYLTESDLNNQKERSTIQDSVTQFHCFTYDGDVNGISIDFRFITKEIYNVDSFDINITMDNNENIKLIQFNSLLSDNNYVRYDTVNNKTINLKEIIPQEHKDTREKLTKYCNEYYYYFRFSNKHAIKNKFIHVKIKTKLTNNLRVIKYDKEFKLFSKEHCYYD